MAEAWQELNSLPREVWISVGAALVSLVGAIVALAALANARKLARKAEVSVPAEATPPWEAAYFESVRGWADEACRQLTVASSLAGQGKGPEQSRRVVEVKMSLMHLLDTGRWYFPNEPEEGNGSDKPPAYQGESQPVLDLLKAAHELVGETDPIGAAALERAKGEFVSHIQCVLNPVTREEEVRALPSRFASVRRNGGKLS